MLRNGTDGTSSRECNIMDRIIINLCIFYIMFPILLFFLGFLNTIMGALAAIFLLFCWINLNNSFDFLSNKEANDIGISKFDIKYFIICLLLVGIWAYFSGIGSFSFQNKDYIVRNAMFRDLINYKWPVVYNLSNHEQVTLVYYFTFWLPAALIGKLSNIALANCFLYLWAVFGIMLIIYATNRFLQKQSYAIILVFIAFSGLDLLGCLIFKQAPLDFITHVEWWAKIFQYSSDTTLLYWVFNQAIPAWLITILILNCKNAKNSAFLGSATFCYSPFATFGMIPIVIFSLLKKNEKKMNSISLQLKQWISLQNLLFPVCILVIYGSFYKLNQNSLNVHGFIFSDSIINSNARLTKSIPISTLIIIIGVFLFFEVGIYILLLIRELIVEHYGFLLVAVGELLVIPFYYMSLCNDFVMRASIPALFILMVMLTRYIIYNKNFISVLIICAIIIGFYTPLCEIDRSIYNTITMKGNEYNNLYSMKDVLTNDDKTLKSYNLTDQMIVLDKVQYFAEDYKYKFFFRILSK